MKLSREQIAAKDAEALASCASPSLPLEGRPGWTFIELGIAQAEARYDVTPLLSPGLRLVLGFELNGVVRRYLFEN